MDSLNHNHATCSASGANAECDPYQPRDEPELADLAEALCDELELHFGAPVTSVCDLATHLAAALADEVRLTDELELLRSFRRRVEGHPHLVAQAIASLDSGLQRLAKRKAAN